MAFRPYVNMGERVQFAYDPLASFLVFATPCTQFPQLNMPYAWSDVSPQIRGTVGTTITPYTTNVNFSSTLGPNAFIQNGYRSTTNLTGAGAISSSTTSAFQFNGQSLTIETYVRWNAAGGRMIFSDYTASNTAQSAIYWPVTIGSPGTMNFYVDYTGGAQETSIFGALSLTMVANTWYHFAVQRNASTNQWMLYQDGVAKGNVVNASYNPNNTTANKNLGNYGSGTGALDGTAVSTNFQDYRIYKGVAKYPVVTVGTTAFTPPPPMIVAP
jgi:hypothetical protein